MKYTFRLFFLCTLLLGTVRCSKNDEPIFPVEPAIDNNRVSVSPTTVQNLDLNNKMTLTFHFTDGDGDLGSSDYPPNFDLLVYVHPEDTIVYKYSIPDLSVEGTSKSIEGDMQVLVPPPAYNPFSTTLPKTISLGVTITDRAGHTSNMGNTGNITVTP